MNAKERKGKERKRKGNDKDMTPHSCGSRTGVETSACVNGTERKEAKAKGKGKEHEINH